MAITSFKVPEFDTNRKLMRVVNTNNLAPVLHRFRYYSVRYVQNRYIQLPVVFNSPDNEVPLGRSP